MDVRLANQKQLLKALRQEPHISLLFDPIEGRIRSVHPLKSELWQLDSSLA